MATEPTNAPTPLQLVTLQLGPNCGSQERGVTGRINVGKTSVSRLEPNRLCSLQGAVNLELRWLREGGRVNAFGSTSCGTMNNCGFCFQRSKMRTDAEAVFTLWGRFELKQSHNTKYTPADYMDRRGNSVHIEV